MAWLLAGIFASYSSYKRNYQYKSRFLPEIEKLQENHIWVIEYQFSDRFSYNML